MTSAPHSWSRETADIETASADYASRFSGPVGEWFLELQARIVLDLLSHLPANASVIDLGGGHAQVAPTLVQAGYRVVVLGSDPSCAHRLTPWLDGNRCRFEVADLQALEYPAESFDAAVCFRLLPHSVNWSGLVRELCRVSRHSVVVDYPSVRSINVFSKRLFGLKKRIERNTRPFMLFQPREVRRAFQKNGYMVAAERPQFLFPMVLHRWLNSTAVGQLIELPARHLGVTRWLGSPIIVRADRERVSAA